MNYTLVGAFVLLLGAVLIGGLLWIASGGSVRKKVDLYLAIEEESVAGLNLNAPVKYNGVEVGKVSDIRLDPVNPEKVRLTFAIEHGTPIKADTVAVLKTQGLTIGAVPPFPYLNDFASAHPASVTAVIWLPKRQSALQI